MPEPVHFDADLYRREALEFAVEKYKRQARVELAVSGAHIVARLEPLEALAEEDSQTLRDEFCNAALSATVQNLRDRDGSEARPDASAANGSPWALLAPFKGGHPLALGWVLDSLSPIRAGAATLLLRHEAHGIARVTLRRNGGAPVGVAHTDHLDFILMNGGGGAAQTEASIARVLIAFAAALQKSGKRPPADALAPLQPHTDGRAPQSQAASDSAPTPRRMTPRIDVEGQTITFEFDDAGISRLALYDAVLTFADRCYVFMTRPGANRVALQLKVKGEATTDTLKALARDVTKALNRVARGTPSAPTPARRAGLPAPPRRQVNVDALLAELETADAATVGIGFEPERGPGHENLRVLNIRGTGACNSECIFCIEKFNPTHRPMLNADGTRELILNSAGDYDMLFFAAGEPTIHPKLFEYVELARSVGFTCFGMSSHFRTFADPHFALKILQAGFEYFDIALHAADATSQLDVNPIGDDGYSLFEALKGLAVLLRLAHALGVRISITHKIVVSRLNVTQLEPVFRATYERGVRHFILQPVRSLGLAPDLQAKLAISEEEIMPHLNEFLRRTQGLGAVIKPYGFSRQQLLSADHVEHEQNRVKNIYGRALARDESAAMPPTLEERPTDGRHWIEVRERPDGRFGFASDGKAPVLDGALDRGLRLNFGCRMGSCGMCCARLLEGRVDQSDQIFLTDEQIEDGFVLLCQARPLSDVVVQVCTDEEIDAL